MKNIVIGILAHVDAGKTTLSEAMLYLSGSTRKLGRVDHQDAFLDTYELERSRGITIFSKQAVFPLGDRQVTLLDTPGHVDFSAEMERCLQVLDYAVLVINGADGVQGHTRTLWQLLKRYRIPTFLFINKMDQAGTDREKVLTGLQKQLDGNCIPFVSYVNDGTDEKKEESHGEAVGAVEDARKCEENNHTFSKYMLSEQMQETFAMCEEELMDKYLSGEIISDQDIRQLIKERKVFPCFFGSALKLDGVDTLMQGMDYWMEDTVYPEKFGAKVFKVVRDEANTRLTYLKVTGGSLKVKSMLSNQGDSYESAAEKDRAVDIGKRVTGAENRVTGTENRTAGKEKEHLGEKNGCWEEKVDQIRIYSGTKFTAVQEVQAGMVCAVTGLTKAYPGEGLGIEKLSEAPMLTPVLSYRVELPEGFDIPGMLVKLRQLEEEEPQLHIVWNEELQEIHARVMGEVQIEILKSLIQERFGISVEFDAGNIVYKETIQEPVEGVGHFEPLRHYAEVHLLLEPGERGSGFTFDSVCSEDVLDRNWQRLILTHLEEKEHRGVLGGFGLTDIKVTLLTGRAHLKHTEGGDFRQATYRAIRHGLMRTKSILLEPWYAYRLEIPSENTGRALSDIQRMEGSFNPPVVEGEETVITGKAPVATMQHYQTEVAAYTRGCGRLFCTLDGYEECHNTDEVLASVSYDANQDLENPPGSVFCAHGAGYNVLWNEVEQHMHLEYAWKPKTEASASDMKTIQKKTDGKTWKEQQKDSWATEKELQEIFARTFKNTTKDRSLTGRTIKRTDHVAGESKATWKSGGNLGKNSGNNAGNNAGNNTGINNGNSLWNSVGNNPKKNQDQEEYLLVDGYNIIFAWEELSDLAKANLQSARDKLMDILTDFQGYRKCTLILVFDAYKVEGNPGEVQKYHNVYVVYTRESETADQYIEKTVHKMGRKYQVTVATSDALEQVIIMGQGAQRLSAQGLKEEILLAACEVREQFLEQSNPGQKHYLFDALPEELAKEMEEVRLGKKKI